SESTYRKLEYELGFRFRNSRFKLNPNKSTLTIDLQSENEVVELKSLIRNVSKEIDIVEREIKETFRKVLVLENLDCANCAAKIERIAKRTFDYEDIIVDFTSTRFIIETTSEEVINNLENKVQEITVQVDSIINLIIKATDARDKH